MPRYIAFLKAINVGGHIVKMDHLRKVFESIGFSNVETFIASGNVIFEAKSKDTAAMEKKIAATLQKTYGYEVATFIRTDADVQRIANHSPFPSKSIATALSFNIGFLPDEPDHTSSKKVMDLQSLDDEFAVHEREIYWIGRKKFNESKVSYSTLEKALGKKATFRGANTVKRLAAKYPCKS